MSNLVKQENQKMGKLGIQLLAYAQLRKKRKIVIGEAAEALGLNKKQEIDLLSRLSKIGIIIRLKRGMYLLPEKIPPGGRWNASEYLLLTELMAANKATYQISGTNAFNFYGYENQVPNRIFVYNNKIYGEKCINGKDFIFIKKSEKKLGSINKFKTKDGIPIIMVSKARALLDAVCEWSRYNTLPKGYAWIADSLKNDSALLKDLINVTAKYGNKASIRRIGFLISVYLNIAFDKKKLKCKLGKSKSLIPWIPGISLKGSVNSEWGVIINGAINE